MKISEQQLLMLFEVAKESCKMVSGMGGYSHETLLQLVNNILNQQNRTLVDVGNLEQLEVLTETKIPK